MQSTLLGFDEYENRQVVRVRLRPGAHLRQTRRKRFARAAIINILHVHHLETGLLHEVLRIKRRIRRQSRLGDQRLPVGMCIQAAFRISEDIDFNLAHSCVEL
jgi:hypothetical protein